MNKVSVFGGTGFIGSAFCKKNADPIVIPRQNVKPESDTVVYFISTVDNYNIFTDSTLDIQTNLIHLMKVLEECKASVKEFIFISSWFVYGNTELPVKETSPCKPKGFYSITKHTAEMMLEFFCKTHGINYKIIRLGNVIGSGDTKVSKKKNVLQYLINEMRYNRDITLYKNGNFTRDFIYIQDVIDGIYHIMHHCPVNEIYNLSSGVPVLYSEVIKYARKKINSSSAILPMSITPFQESIQIDKAHIDVTKLRQLGFTSRYSIYDMIDILAESENAPN